MEAAEKSGRPRNRDYARMLDTKEGQKAVEEAAAKMLQNPDVVNGLVARLAGQLNTARTEAGAEGAAADPGADQSLMRQLAMAIAEISDQGTNRKRVPPAELAKREEAHARMVDMLIRLHARGIKPTYALVAPVYLNERLIQPFFNDPATKKVLRQTIDWSGIPNEAMRPVNDPAREVFNEFLASIGGMTALTKDAERRPFNVTPNGLTIRGALQNKREVGSLDATLPGQFGVQDDNKGPDLSVLDDLKVRGPFDPTASEVNVLGTIAAPAKQNYQAGAVEAR